MYCATRFPSKEADTIPLRTYTTLVYFRPFVSIAGTRSVRCDIEPKGEGRLLVLVNENVHELELLDERRLRLRRAAGKFSLEGPQRVDAPMPGKIARVLVKVGAAARYREPGSGEPALEVRASNQHRPPAFSFYLVASEGRVPMV